MQAIIIGAGRGARLMPTTADAPKCFAEVAGKRILDWTLEAFRAAGIERVGFIGGYRIEKVRAEYPGFTFRHNADWPENNILASLFCAEDLMDGGFLCCYSDILFTPGLARRLIESDEPMRLGVDTLWLERYKHRSEHPTHDAEKVAACDGHVTRVAREIPEHEAYGEFVGVAAFSAEGAGRLRRHYHRCRALHAGRPFREAQRFEKAYLIQLLQEMIEVGERFGHVDTPGGYVEIDTQQDFDYARKHWTKRHLNCDKLTR